MTIFSLPDSLHRRHEPRQPHVPRVRDDLPPLRVHDRFLNQWDEALDGGEETLAPGGQAVRLGQESPARRGQEQGFH